MLPLFYLRTAQADLLAVPEYVSSSNLTTRINLFELPSLRAVVGTSRTASVTVVIGGIAVQSPVTLSSGDTLTSPVPLYRQFDALNDTHGTIYAWGSGVRSIVQMLNSPDYSLTEQRDSASVILEDGVLLRIPIREIQRRYSSEFLASAFVTAPTISTFIGGGGGSITTFITLPDYAFSKNIVGDGEVVTPTPTTTIWQPPLKMSSKTWIVFGVFWAILAVIFVLTVGITYSWYVSQYL